MNQITPYKSAYRAEIDGLRAFAVLSVVLFHAFPSILKGGFIGVDVFFVISGFLISSHIFEKLDEGKFSFIDFFSRRIRRIFPALILVMGSSLAFGYFALLADEYNQLGKHAASGAAFVLNFILADEVGYFETSAELKPMLHLWSLAVEEQFYIVWPLCLWLAWKKRFNLLAVTSTIMLGSFFLNTQWVIDKPTETFFWPFSRFWEFLTGSVLAWFVVHRDSLLNFERLGLSSYFSKMLLAKKFTLYASMIANAMSLSGLMLLALSVLFIHKGLPFPSTLASLPILGALLVITAGARAWSNRIILMNPLAVWFGLISYPLYLWHWPILSFLHIMEDGTPHRDKTILAIIIAIILAWLTYKFIETPIRFGKSKERLKPLLLIGIMANVGIVGFLISKTDLTDTHSVETLNFRAGLEHRIGSSSRWYKGKDDWLFVGNNYNNTVAKLKLFELPSNEAIEVSIQPFRALADTAALSDTRVVLFVGPNKSSIYKEFLPDKLVVSDKRYSTFFLDKLRNTPNLIVYDPVADFLRKKASEGLLYWRTNTHWNLKGAFLAYKGFSQLVDLPHPKVEFKAGPLHRGDLIDLSNLNDFPLSEGDDWQVSWKKEPNLSKKMISTQLTTSFGTVGIVTNAAPLVDKSIWVTGDSFSESLKQYFNATFREVRYLGHWKSRLQKLPQDLIDADEKPDLVIVVRAERSF